MRQSPREFMKMRRPERFSDTVIAKKGNLNRTILEYKLDVITSNGQELEFQNFSFKLAQLEIAPNLRPQTGPSGGGDSKADSETYPVSDFIRLYFWEGLANDSEERWAIAISANKDWITKAKKDAKGIADTDRNYKKIFFITNQFTKDKKRAEIEDNLSKALSIPVVIFDRTWILDRVFKNNRQKLAIDELSLGEGLEDEIIVGPNDIERIKKFELVNKEIEQALSNAIITVKIIDKALDAALLARGMGKPRSEVDGLFDRAVKMAKRFGSEELVYTSKYQHAWTTFFWFEDFEKFVDLYEELESIAETSVNIYTLERQNTLSGLLKTLPFNERISTEYTKIKIESLKNWLTVFVNDDTRPSASHQARMLLALDNLFENAVKKEDLSKNFIEMGNILKDAERLIGFSYEESIATIQENGDVFGAIPEYENLINLIAEIDTKRKGEIPAAKSLLKFGLQHLESERYYKAIEFIGRSVIGLYKKESKGDFIHALYFIAHAYEQVGLLWAARGSLIHAASYATDSFRQYQEVNELQCKCCRRLKMIELKLGRIGFTLEWHQADLFLSQQIAMTQEERNAVYEESLGNYSGILGCLLLKTRPCDLPNLEKAPDLFNRLAIDFSGLAVLYLLGGEKYLPVDFWQTIGDQPVTDFFNRWMDQPARYDLPARPDYYMDEMITIESNILGTHFIFETKNASPGIEICEMIVAAMEAYLSTAITMQTFGKVSEFKVLVEEKSNIDQYIQAAELTEGSNALTVLYKQFNPNILSVEVQTEIGQSVTDVIIRIISKTIAFADADKALKELIVDQRVNERSFNFLSPLVMLGNVLGHKPRRAISQWIDEKDNRYPFDGVTSRIKPVNNNSRLNSEDKNDDFEHKGHQYMKTLSVINQALWEGHVWRGFAFFVDPNPHSIQSPILYLMFDNRKNAIEIFKEWNERFGDTMGEKIRISILKGIDSRNPYWYKGIIGPNMNPKEFKNGQKVIVMSKVSMMTPTNPKNLENFLESYSRFGYYTLAPFYMDFDKKLPEPLNELGFVMKELSVRNAWEVGINDIDMTAIEATDKPVIPAGISSVPVLELLKKKQSKEGKPT